MIDKNWQYKPKPDPIITAGLAEELKLPKAIARLLVQRGITNYQLAKDFFRPDWSHLHDPFLMKDMDCAVERIQKALTEKERIMIFGDYDVDGTTAVALMTDYLSNFDSELTPYIPDRHKEGYGISKQGVDYAIETRHTLIIALDCGIKAHEHIHYARKRGIDFIICDHHLPGETLPNAVAVLDPKRHDCPYPYKELCGCGIGFKLIQALDLVTGHKPDTLEPFLDLVVTAIAADIVPITGENRALAYLGLERLNRAVRPGLAALLRNIKTKPYNIRDLAFAVGPRINAAGRIMHGTHAVELLLAESNTSAKSIADVIEQFNLERRSLDKKITSEALDQIIECGDQKAAASVVYDPNWHKGVLGIVASRLTETYYRPTAVFTRSDDHLVASVRSVKGFDVYKALEQCNHYMLQFGGHKYAAGLTLSLEKFEGFKEAFNNVVEKTITKEQKLPQVLIDLPLSLTDITPKFYRILSQFAPFGPENPRPVFVAEGLRVSPKSKPVGLDNIHLKLLLSQDNQSFIDGIAFGYGVLAEQVREKGVCDVAFMVDENHWQGQTKLQLLVKDLKVEPS